MSIDMKLKVAEIQHFCMHDGPGVRTTVFFKGCPLRCAWCHNPETQNRAAELLFYPSKCIGCKSCEISCPQGAHTVDEKHLIDRKKCRSCFACTQNCPTNALELCGREMSLGEILSVTEKDRAFYGSTGGITLSGGEPFMQGVATVALLRAFKERELSTVVETCGYADADILRAAVPYVDLFLWDVKDTDDERHKHYTGVSNRRILKNLRLVDGAGAKTRLRCILVNGINTNETHYKKIAKLARELKHCEGVEFIPYHAYGGAKATHLGNADNGRREWIPTPLQIEEAKRILTLHGAPVF